MKITTIRHGQTVWNSEGRWQGHTDIALDKTGLLQGQKVGVALAGAPCDIIYTSDLSRAIKTAELIGAHHDVPIVINTGLREMCFGIFEGRRVDETIAEKAEYDKKGMTYPGAESLMDVYTRVKAFLDDALTKGHENIFLVSHGGTLRSVFYYFLGLSVEELLNMQVDNTAVHVFEKRGDIFVMTKENDTSHLD